MDGVSALSSSSKTFFKQGGSQASPGVQVCWSPLLFLVPPPPGEVRGAPGTPANPPALSPAPGAPPGSGECPSSHSWLPFPHLKIFFWSPGQVMLKIPVKNTSFADLGSWRPWACCRSDSPAGLGKQKRLEAFGSQRGWQVRRCYKRIPGYRPPEAPWRVFHR